MIRRDFFKCLPAGAVAASLPIVTPIELLFDAWKQQRDLWREAVDRGSETEEDARFLEMDAIEDRIMIEASQTPKDMAIKMLVSHGFGSHSCVPFDGPAWAEARALIGFAA